MPAPAPRRATAAAAVLAALCVVALASPAAALVCNGGKDGYLKLDLVFASQLGDPLARCLTSFAINLAANCTVSVTALAAGGSFVDAVWSSYPERTPAAFQPCPEGEGAPLLPASMGSIPATVRRAISEHVYGPDKPLDLHPTSGVAYAAAGGRVTLTRVNPSATLHYAITESTLLASDLGAANVGAIDDCDDLITPADQCRDESSSPDGVASACGGGRRAVQVGAAIRVCALCPSGMYGDDGYSCQPCDAGTITPPTDDQYGLHGEVGWDTCDNECPPGTYSPGGYSTCLPCPANTFADSSGSAACSPCPPDAYAPLPGSAVCARCVEGIPQACGSGGCPSGQPSSPGSHVAAVARLDQFNNYAPGTCDLEDAYEVQAVTNCPSWRTSPVLKLALSVAGDCSIDIRPIGDPAPGCSDAVGASAENVAMQGFYQWDETNSRFAVRSQISLQQEAPMLSIDISESSDLVLALWGASTLPDAAAPPRQVCISKLTVLGGQVAGLPVVPESDCPNGTYSEANQYCPACPAGYSCSDGELAKCPAGTANPILGLSGACPACTGNFTSTEGASTCAVPAPNKDCMLASTGNVGTEWDIIAGACMPCPAGTRRDDDEKACVECPAGYFSSAGAATCTPCPIGQFNPSEGLANQTALTGRACLRCPAGSIALTGAQSAGAVADANMTTGATFCDACPAGTWQDTADPTKACKSCTLWPVYGRYTYRTGDATPENNECQRVPSGYKIRNATHSGIVLCEAGKVSFWDAAWTTRYPSGNGSQPYECIACSALDSALGGQPRFAHSYAPRQGMISCIACPVGTVPNITSGATTGCQPCGPGTYRGVNDINAACLPCGTGREVGPSNHQDCNACAPGTFMNSSMVAANESFCAPCPVNYYRTTTGAASCLPCPRGTEARGTGNTECTPCAVGYFNNREGVACSPALPGTFVNTIGAFIPTTCPVGTFVDEFGQDSCLPCAPGKYSNTFGSKECKTCPAGTFSQGQASSCKPCSAGFFSSAGANVCRPCLPGTYGPSISAGTCRLCPKGFQCPTRALRSVQGCPAGTFSNKEGNTICRPCPINTYSLGGSPTKSVLACIKCPRGTYTRGFTGQSACQKLRPQTR